MKRFKKIKWDQKAVTLMWTTESGTETHEHELTSQQEPHADLNDAMQSLVGDVLRVCELGSAAGTLRVQSVSLSYSEKSGLRGAVVTALKPVSIANAPVVLNTPHLAEDGDQEKGVMPRGMWNRIMALEFEAEAYLDGKRAPKAQLDLLSDADDDANDDVLAGTMMSINGGPMFPANDTAQAMSALEPIVAEWADRHATTLEAKEQG